MKATGRNRLLILMAAMLPLLPLLAAPAGAIGPAPGVFDPVTQRSYSTGDPLPMYIEEPAPLDANGVRGSRHILVIGAHASDRSNVYTAADFEDLLFSEGTHASGSMRDYYLEVSYGQFEVTGEVEGFYALPQPYANYTQGNYGLQGGGRDFAVDAVAAADAAGVDFSIFDDDGDGIVESVVIIHQGPDGATTGNSNDLWSHMGWFPSNTVYDGVTLKNYNMDPERQIGGDIETIGVFCHEYGHSLGLPDLYTNENVDDPVGRWGMMSAGSYNGPIGQGGSVPAHFTAWSRIQLGWIEPTELTANQTGIPVPAVENHSGPDVIYRLTVNSEEKEYFLIENRWNEHPGLFDHNGLSDKGLLIYHCDERNGGGPQTSSPFWHVDIENPSTTTTNRNKAAFSQEDGEDEFTRESTPADSSGHYLASGIDITNVSVSGEDMTFDLELFPTFDYDHLDLIDLGGGEFELVVHVQSLAVDALDVTASLLSENANLTILDAVADYPDTDGAETIANVASPFRFRVEPAAGQDELAELMMRVRSDREFVSQQIRFNMIMNPSPLLFVDDDQNMRNIPADDEVNYLAALDALGEEYATWEIAVDGEILEAALLSLYDVVVWNAGAHANGALSDYQEKTLRSYLDQGGRLFLSSQEVLYQEIPSDNPGTNPDHYDYRTLTPGLFAYDYLKVREVEHDEYYYQVDGVTGDPITQGWTFDLEDPFSDDPTGATSGDYDWWPDNITVDPTAATIFTSGPHDYPPAMIPDLIDDTVDDLPQGPCALRYPAVGDSSDYRVVFFAFPWEGLQDGAHTGTEVMANILAWLRLGETGGPGVTIEVPAMIHPGEEFAVTGRLFNPDAPMTDVPTFFVLEVAGEFWFWPGWKHYAPPAHTDIDYRLEDVPTGTTPVEVIAALTWPDTGTETMTGLHFFGAMLDPGMTEVLGRLGTAEWGYGPAK